MKTGYLNINKGFFKRALLTELIDSIEELRIKAIKAIDPKDDEFIKNTPYAIEEYYNTKELYEKVQRELELLVKEFPNLEEFQMLLLPEINKLMNVNIHTTELLDSFYKIFSILHIHLQTFENCDENTSEVYVNNESLHILINLIGENKANTRELSISEYLNLISTLISTLRKQERKPTFEERLGIRIAYELLAKGNRFDSTIIPWGNSGFRDVQTYASITDPGIGHLYGTLDKNSNLKGVIVHIEHLERGGDQNREEMEPYRIPNFNIIGKVKLNVGKDAPSSSYVGRPVFESKFKPSALKTVHTLAAACSAIFMDGLTECKLAIERMTASEAITFLKYMSGNIRRDKYTQALSAAFNINTPILDDRDETLVENNGKPKLITSRFEIGMLGIEIVKAGGFDKVTWDGTANTYPSKCVIEQLTFSEALTLVHKAHEEGLITYFSAGFRFNHLPQVIYTGVDGIGLGGAQILRYMDKDTGYHGPFKEENISKIIDIREEAIKDVRGKAAILLSRLDRMYFEKSITPEDNEKRDVLYKQLRDENVDELATTIDELAHIDSLPNDESHPLIGWAGRIISAGTSSIAAQSIGRWEEFIVSLREAMVNQDYERLAEQLLSIQEALKESHRELVTV
ncbi:hypothetical protein [Metabacillus niabensis]|uniref:hypothetical protein n=1 Tax=Metabacillus niabensis TaxID=324854 RepID=UPI001CFAAA0C|nr:hypothetical protein [Metabacillus niabensis]